MLHPLKIAPSGADFVAASVSGNWRVVFEFDGWDASNINLMDYHRRRWADEKPWRECITRPIPARSSRNCG